MPRKPVGYHSLPYERRPYGRPATGRRDTERYPTTYGPPTSSRRFIGGRAWKRLRATQHANAGHPGAHDGWCSLCQVTA